MSRSTTVSVPRLVRGSVLVHSRRCGNATCHCSDGISLHQSTVLSYSEAGRTRFLMLPDAWIKPVRTATERYRTQRTELEERANQGLADLVASLAATRRRS